MEFNNKANFYEEKAYVQQDLVRWGLPKMTEINGEVLELGSGTGFLTRELVKKSHSVTASDISKEMLTLGKQLVPQAQWQLLDAWNPPTNRQYDWICSASLLQWASDPLKILKKWRTCLKNQGKLGCLFFISGTLRQLDDLSPLKWRSLDEWIHIFLKAGFKINNFKFEEKNYLYKDYLDLLHYFQYTGMYKKNSIPYSQIRNWIQKNNDKPINTHWNFCYIEGINSIEKFS